MTSEVLLNMRNSLGVGTAAVTIDVVHSQCREIYEQNRHRLYSLAFWMTGNELLAETLLERAFARAFTITMLPDSEALDSAMICELERLHSLRILTLKCAPATRELSVRKSAKRADLEEAVLRLPSCEKMIFLLHDVEGYSLERIARLLGLDGSLISGALYQARLRLRELMAAAVGVARAA